MKLGIICSGVCNSWAYRKPSCTSLVPKPPPFLPSVCIHSNTRERKTSEKWGRPGSIHHVSGCKGGNIQICTYQTWKRVSYRSRWVVSITLMSGVQNCNRVLKWMIQCIVLVVGPSPPYVHLASTSWWMFPGLSHFNVLPIFRFCVSLWMQTEGKNEGGLGMRLHVYHVCTCDTGLGTSCCWLLALVNYANALIFQFMVLPYKKKVLFISLWLWLITLTVMCGLWLWPIKLWPGLLNSDLAY